jgi:nitrogen-specific signal transduction histidine kinase
LIDRHDLYQVLLTLAQYVFSIWPEDLGGEISLIEKSGNKQYMLNFVYTHCNAAHNKCSPFNPLPNKENDSGLYLYITKKMVIDAGGTLTFKKDSENAGFYLCLPIGNT